jgi:hypothetical protein
MMALTFGPMHMEGGRPLTIFLNDEGVKVGPGKMANEYAQHWKMRIIVDQRAGDSLSTLRGGEGTDFTLTGMP